MKNLFRLKSLTVNVTCMFSAIRGTISGALSSFPSFREPIHPKRLSSDISTQSDDPAILPLPAHMPYSRSTTYSNTDTKRRKGAKATEFLNEHFNPAGNDDDPIEVRTQLGLHYYPHKTCVIVDLPVISRLPSLPRHVCDAAIQFHVLLPERGKNLVPTLSGMKRIISPQFER